MAAERTGSMRARQAVAIAVGLVYGVLGGIAIARTGFGPLFRHVDVVGLHHTTLMGYSELLYGVIMLAVGALPGADRSILIFLGAVATGFGIVVLATGGTLHHALGVHGENGALFLITGAVSLLAGLFLGRPAAAVGPAPPGEPPL